MEKQVKKHIRIKILPFFLVVLGIGIVGVGIYLATFIPIQNIYIVGNKHLSDQEIIELANIENYPSFLKTSCTSISKKIKENPYVKKVHVTKRLLAEIHIEIEEENLLFRKEENQKIVLENKEEVEDNHRYQLPILLNYVPDTKYDSFIKGMNAVTESVKAQISEIRYYPNTQDEDRFLLYMNDGNSVYLTLTKFKQINYYEDVLKELEGKKGILYLDSGNHFRIMEE